MAYPSGFAFDLMTMAGLREHQLKRHDPGQRPAEEGIPPELLRIGVEFSDGTKATNVGGFHHREDPPPGPVMHSGGGGGGGGSWHQHQWVWPLPPPGPMSFVCQWPAAEVPVTRAEIEAHVILEAAQRARVIFPDQDPSPQTASASWTSYAPLSKPKPQPPSE